MGFFMDMLGIAPPTRIDEADGKSAVWSRPGCEIRVTTDPEIGAHFQLTVDDVAKELPTRELVTCLRLHFPAQPAESSQVAALAFWEGVQRAASYIASGRSADRQQALALVEVGFRALADTMSIKEPVQ